MALQDILAGLNDPAKGYGSEVPRTNAFVSAPLLAQAVANFQKQQRVAPLQKALEMHGRQYGAAQSEEEQQRANAMANLARAAFIKSGGSPLDVPQNLWGGDTSQGFQTGAAEFTPPYSGDNLTLGQRLKQLSFAKEEREKELHPLELALKRAEITKALRPPSTGTGGYSTSQRTDDLMKVWQIRGVAPAGLEGLGVSAGTPYPGSKGNVPGEQEKYLEAMTNYVKAIKGKTAKLKDVYDEIDTHMTIGTISSNLGEIMKAKLKEVFEKEQPQETAVNPEEYPSWQQ